MIIEPKAAMAPATQSAVTPASGTEEESLYADYVKVYPKKVAGSFRTLKTAALAVLLGFYYLAPWLRWDRGPNAPGQAILIDMPGRRAYFFGIEIWPQEVYYLTGLLILAAIGLFFITALLGRVWCGFACWQTVWTDLYVWVERWFEGDRNARMKLDRAPWSAAKALRKLGKHAVWLVIAVATGGAFVLWFSDAPTVVVEIVEGTAGAGVYTFLGLFTATTYLLAGWAREQVCIYMCPWPRFQAAMFDEDSLIVTYEAWRGEPRGKPKAGQAVASPERGHCVDCRLCVHVCPTGTDIRLGQQLSCIGCALCIDACNSVMDKLKLPRHLITYDSVNNQVSRSRGEPTRFRLVRPRTVIYSALLLLVTAVMLFTLLTRSVTEVNVLHERSPLFVTLSDGSIRNTYTFKVLNKVREERSFTLSAAGIDGVALSGIGVEERSDGRLGLTVKGDAVGSFRVFVTAPRANLTDKSMTVHLELTDAGTGQVLRHASPFAGPVR